MKFIRSCRQPAAILVLVLAAAFTLAAAHPDDASQARVSVHYANPHQFTESHQMGFGVRYDHDGYMEKIRSFLIRKATPMLEPGQHLSITFTNIDLAGGFEPWRGPRMAGVRIMSRMYPPRFDFTFKLTDADGRVVREGTRKLTNLTYLMDQAARPGDSDPLRYDKGMLEQWLRRGPAHW